MANRNLIIAKTALGAGAAFSLYETRKRSKSELINLAAEIDRDNFNNWFSTNGVIHESIAAMWLTESAGNPRATNFDGGDGAQGGAWGLGQVTAKTATDYGIFMPLAPIMLYPKIGGRVSMEHVRFTVQGLRASGLSATAFEWVQAYNVGLTGFVNGRRNDAHYRRFLSNLTTGVLA